ncbi:MAG: hypothetical protein ACK4MV_04905 [Beijerinckiaceae bacterium]
MHPDELNKPLGLDADSQARGREIPWGGVALAGLVLLGAGVFAFARLTDPPKPENPASLLSAIAPVQPVAHGREPGAGGGVSFDDATGSIARPSRANASDVEEASGVRVVRQGGASAPGALIITVPREFPADKAAVDE